MSLVFEMVPCASLQLVPLADGKQVPIVGLVRIVGGNESDK